MNLTERYPDKEKIVTSVVTVIRTFSGVQCELEKLVIQLASNLFPLL
jgi:hypothetical protein